MNGSASWRLGRRPALDGLRGIAVLLVVAFHFDRSESLPLGGEVGVTIFFTLSGFLITSLLLTEKADTGRISLPGFYARRARRLLPALGILLVTVLALQLVGWPLRSPGWVYLGIVTYSTNWFVLAHHGQYSAMTHTWTLAIEEQFYLAWPLVVVGVSRWGRRAVLSIAVTGSVASLAWGLETGRSIFATDVSAWTLLAGCVLAAFMHGRTLASPSLWWSFALLPALPIVLTSWSRTAYVMVPILTVATLFVAAQRPIPWLEPRWLRWVGVRSYGLYLWHYPVCWLSGWIPGPWVPISATGVLVSFLICATSWRWIEQPILKQAAQSPGVPTHDPYTRIEARRRATDGVDARERRPAGGT